MIAAQWHKVINDLLSNKTRTVLIILSIMVGLFAVGTITSARHILLVEMAKAFAQINPSSGVIRTVQPFGNDFIQSVRSMPGVEEVDARRMISARIKVNDGDWTNITIYAVDDYQNMRVNKIFPQEGAFPPPNKEILIERIALNVIHARIGDTITIKLPNEKLRTMRIARTTHDMAQLPAQIDGTPYGYISAETLKWFGEKYGYNELQVVAVKKEDKKAVQELINEIKDKAERAGYIIPISMTAEPGQLPLDDVLQAILMLMGVLGMLALFLSAFLIINTISALLTQQKRQIGVMKAVGATTAQIMRLYLILVLFYGLVALMIAIPLSIIGARTLSALMASLFNFDLKEMYIPVSSYLMQIAVGLLVPLLASIYPFLANLRISAAEAMSSYGTAVQSKQDIIERLLSGSNLWVARYVVRRSLLLSIRNTFRSKGRLLLTLFTLTLAGAIFVSVFTIRASLMRTVDDLMAMWGFDVMINLTRPYRTERVTQEALRVPGVEEVDSWSMFPARRIRPDDSESVPIYLFAPHIGKGLAASPTIFQGRWLLPEDENAVVVSSTLIKEEPDVKIGDKIVLKVNGKKHLFQVVGISMGFSLPMAYTSNDYALRITNNVGYAETVLVKTANRHPQYIDTVSKALEKHFEQAGISINAATTIQEERSEAEAMFGIITSLLLFMAVLLALVGGLGLMGTMSINVLERTREIGVLRAIGAANMGVAWVFILEGISIGGLSWIFSALLAAPISKALSSATGTALIGQPLTFTYSVAGLWAWLLLIITLSALASYLPARGASRLTVREVLAYE